MLKFARIHYHPGGDSNIRNKSMIFANGNWCENMYLRWFRGFRAKWFRSSGYRFHETAFGPCMLKRYKNESDN